MVSKTLGLFVVAALLATSLVALHYWLLDGLDGFVFGLLSRTEDTVYASGYSDAAFRKVRSGMTEAEVHGLLGPPLDRYGLHGEHDLGERWSRSANSQDYRCRVILFRAGRVAQKHSELYLD